MYLASSFPDEVFPPFVKSVVVRSIRGSIW
jgi:hypothetical protein